MAKFKTPVEGFNGVVAGVSFSDGVGETDDEHAIVYFIRHGYKTGTKEPGTAPAGKVKPKAARKPKAAAKTGTKEPAAVEDDVTAKDAPSTADGAEEK